MSEQSADHRPQEDFPQLNLDGQLCFPLYAAARKVVNHYTPYLKPLGITYTQYIVLLALWESGSATVGDLCRRLYLDNGTITPLLKKMEEMGIVSRSRSRQDERVVTVQMTEQGWIMRQQVKDIPFQVGSCIPLSHDDAFALYQLLHKLLGTV
ncbi:MAG: MarR family transcriptional regulator [Clostridia bacterium]|nr:MarR family transcriptional regulator [Clostridia bacterium]